jgi:cob(I)alamin adenosyltransferase
MLAISIMQSVVVNAAGCDEDDASNIGKEQYRDYDYRDIERELEKAQTMVIEFRSIVQEQEAMREGIKLMLRDIDSLNKKLDVLEKLALPRLKSKNSKSSL